MVSEREPRWGREPQSQGGKEGGLIFFCSGEPRNAAANVLKRKGPFLFSFPSGILSTFSFVSSSFSLSLSLCCISVSPSSFLSPSFSFVYCSSLSLSLLLFSFFFSFSIYKFLCLSFSGLRCFFLSRFPSVPSSSSSPERFVPRFGRFPSRASIQAKGNWITKPRREIFLLSPRDASAKGNRKVMAADFFFQLKSIEKNRFRHVFARVSK